MLIQKNQEFGGKIVSVNSSEDNLINLFISGNPIMPPKPIKFIVRDNNFINIKNPQEFFQPKLVKTKNIRNKFKNLEEFK